MAHYIGIDIGSTATKCVAIDGCGEVLAQVVVTSGAGTKADKKAIDILYQKIKEKSDDCLRIVATGYGRMLYSHADEQISEITCHAKGLHYNLKSVRTLIDVGGQDLKAIAIDSSGMIEQFVMNDKCAAGTGRFLEVMCRVMNIKLEDLAKLDANAKHREIISSTCTVFAESEVISKLSQGIPIPDIVAGVHDSVARKIAGLTKRIGVRPDIAMTGGGALNKGLVNALSRIFEENIIVPDEPQMMGAYGAALIAARI